MCLLLYNLVPAVKVYSLYYSCCLNIVAPAVLTDLWGWSSEEAGVVQTAFGRWKYLGAT